MSTLSTAMTMPCRANTRPRALLLTGAGQRSAPNRGSDARHHEFHNEKIAPMLGEIVDLTVTEDLSVLNDAALRQYGLVLNNSMYLAPTPSQLEAFYRFVSEGGAYFALHSGIASFLNSDRYSTLVGGRLVAADEFKSFRVDTFDMWFGLDHVRETKHEIARGLAPFTTSDELYLVQTNTAELQVIARAENHPIMWLRSWGAGKVMCLALGDAPVSVENAGYQNLLKNGVRWLVGYPLLDPIPSALFAANSRRVEYLRLRDFAHHPKGDALSFVVTKNSDSRLVTPSIDGKSQLSLSFAPGATGQATITIEAQDSKGRKTPTDLKLEVRERGIGNLSVFYGTTVTTSSNEKGTFTADGRLAVDGDQGTRWSSDYVDPSWIQLDLSGTFVLGRTRLVWEAAYARQYELQVSDDAKRWRTIHRESAGNGGIDDIAFPPVRARYVRMYGIQRATRWGYSLHEFEIYPAPKSAQKRGT